MNWEAIKATLLRHPALYVAAAILFLGLLIAIITLVISNRRNNAFRRDLEYTANSSRIYIINYNDQSYRYFNVMTPRHVVGPLPLASFYSRFPKMDARKVMNWVSSLLDIDSDVRDYLEVEVNLGESHRTCLSLLEADSVNYESGIIHLQSFLFKSIAPSARGVNSIKPQGLSNFTDYLKAMTDSFKKRGATLCFRFCYRRLADRDLPMEPLVINQLKNALYPFVVGNRMLLSCSENELVIADFHISPKPDALRLAKTCMASIRRYLSINGLNHKIDVRCAIVGHSSLHHVPESVLEQARITAANAFLDNRTIVYFEKGKDAMDSAEALEVYHTEVERIIRNNRILVSFRPIYDLSESRVHGYLVKAKPVNTHFSSMEELYEYASKTGDDKHLFATVARNAFPVFAAENRLEKVKLFYPVHLEDRGTMLSTFGRMVNAKNIDVVFLFNEADIRAHLDPEKMGELAIDLKDIKAKGHQVALLLEEGELTLPSEVYGAYDYFVCGFGFAGAAADMDAKIRSKLHTLVEKLLKYDKPIIASDINGWDAIEIIVRSGLKFISSDVFCPFDRMVTLPSSKAIRRIEAMRD